MLLLQEVQPPQTPALEFGYHGTNAVTPTFDPELGAFFANRPSTAQRYGRNVSAYRIRMDHPAHWSPELVSGFQDYLFDLREKGYPEEALEQFRCNQVRAGVAPSDDHERMDDYVQAVLRQSARSITFSDTDPVFNLLRQHLMEEGHDGLVRPHEFSDNMRDGTDELIPFHAHQFAPLLAPDAPAAVAQTKLRDDAGLPLVVYRGEQGGRKFERFDRRKTRENGFFFTPARDIAAGYARPDEPRAFLIAADRVLDLTRDTRSNRAFVEEWAKSFDEWKDRRSGDAIAAFDVLESGEMFDYEGDWSCERWRDLQATAEVAGFDVVILPDLDHTKGVFPSVVVFRPDQIWELKPPAPDVDRDDLGQALLRPGSRLPLPHLAPEPAILGAVAGETPTL